MVSSTRGSIERTNEPLVSLVVPVLNEQEVIEIFLEQTNEVPERAGVTYKIVFVTDEEIDWRPPKTVSEITHDR